MGKDKIEQLEEKIKELQARKQKMIALEKQKERKERSKRLIEIGAIFETYFEIESKEEALKIAKGFASHVKKNKAQLHKEVQLTEEEKKKHKIE